MQSIPLEERHTLQLVKAVGFLVKPVGKRLKGAQKWEGRIINQKRQTLTATITEPVFVRRLELGHEPQVPCLVTVSLSMPWQPADGHLEEACWKLIAAAIELPKG